MSLEAWFPIGFTFPNGQQSRLPSYESTDWHIYENNGSISTLIAKETLVKKWISSGLISESLLTDFKYGKELFFSYSCDADYILSPLEECLSPDHPSEALAFAESLRATRENDKESSLHDSIYLEKISRLLPTYTLSVSTSDDVVLGSYLTGGVGVPVSSFRRLSSIMSWLAPESIKEIVEKAGLEVNVLSENSLKSGEKKLQVNKPFELPGRSSLESFISEHIIDIIINADRYKTLGIDFPASIILHGPPGCGKTFAIERLVEYLGWPSYEIESSNIASPYIHETSKKVAEVFEKAIDNSPSVLIIDEMEAFLTDRQSGTGHHRVEEVAEFLRRIPEANQNRVLVIAMTNHIEMGASDVYGMRKPSTLRGDLVSDFRHLS